MSSEKDSLKQKEKQVNLEDHLVYKSDKIPIILLLSMYSIQGILFAYFGQTLQLIFSEKPDFEYSKIGILSFCTYPFSFKIAFAPILDSIYSSKFGQRKSYIVPTQYAKVILFIICAYIMEDLIQTENVFQITSIGFGLVFFASIQDIAVDAWALKLLSHHHRDYASSLQSAGIAIGMVAANTGYLEGCKQFPEFFNAKSFFLAIALFTFLLTLVVQFLISEDFHNIDEQYDKLHIEHNQEKEQEENLSLLQVIKTLSKFLNHDNLRFLILHQLFRGVGLAPMLNTFQVRLVKQGFSKEYLADIFFLLTPFKLVLPIFLVKLYKKKLGLAFTSILTQIHILIQIAEFLFLLNVDYFLQHSSVATIVLFVLFQVNQLSYSLAITSRLKFFGKIAQKGMEASYIACFASVGNLGYKLWGSGYLFLSDYLNHDWEYIVIISGFVYSQVVLLATKNRMAEMEHIPKSEWAIKSVPKKSDKEKKE